MIDVLTEICNRIWRTGEWPTPWTQSLIITRPKKGNLQLCQNYRTISLISHLSKIILEVILNRLKPQAEEIIAEEQAGFRAGRSTTDQIRLMLCFNHIPDIESMSSDIEVMGNKVFVILSFLTIQWFICSFVHPSILPFVSFVKILCLAIFDCSYLCNDTSDTSHN